MNASSFTVIVRCADPRLDRFFSEPNLRARMRLSAQAEPLEEAVISNVGGLLSLAGADVSRLVHDAGLLLSLFGNGGGRVVLTAHDSCGGYNDAVSGAESAMRLRQEEDLRFAAGALREAIPGSSIDCFYLHTDEGLVTEVAL